MRTLGPLNGPELNRQYTGRNLGKDSQDWQDETLSLRFIGPQLGNYPHIDLFVLFTRL